MSGLRLIGKKIEKIEEQKVGLEIAYVRYRVKFQDPY